jgi:hypothetical protein
VPGARLQADLRERLRCRGPRVAAPGQLQRQHDVLERGERRDQVERLEYEADPLRAHAGTPVLIELREVLALE